MNSNEPIGLLSTADGEVSFNNNKLHSGESRGIFNTSLLKVNV